MNLNDQNQLDAELRDIARERHDESSGEIHGVIMNSLEAEWKNPTRKFSKAGKRALGIAASLLIGMIGMLLTQDHNIPEVDIDAEFPPELSAVEFSIPLPAIRLDRVPRQFEGSNTYANLAENFTSSVTAPLRATESVSFPLRALHLPTSFEDNSRDEI